MMHVIGRSGWWSRVIPFLRQPITKPMNLIKIEAHRQKLSVRTFQDTWNDHGEDSAALDWLFDKYKYGDPVVLFGHSYGASAITHDARALAKRNVPVELLLSMDQGADSWVIRDRLIENNVRNCLELRVSFERLSFIPHWQGVHRFEQLPKSGGHTRTFLQPEMVRRIVKEVLSA